MANTLVTTLSEARESSADPGGRGSRVEEGRSVVRGEEEQVDGLNLLGERDMRSEKRQR